MSQCQKCDYHNWYLYKTLSNNQLRRKSCWNTSKRNIKISFIWRSCLRKRKMCRFTKSTASAWWRMVLPCSFQNNICIKKRVTLHVLLTDQYKVTLFLLSEPDFNDFPDIHAYLLHRSALRRNVHAHVLYTVHLDYRKFFHIIEFKLFCVSEMLEDLSVFVCNAYPRLFFSSFTLFFWYGQINYMSVLTMLIIPPAYFSFNLLWNL